VRAVAIILTLLFIFAGARAFDFVVTQELVGRAAAVLAAVLVGATSMGAASLVRRAARRLGRRLRLRAVALLALVFGVTLACGLAAVFVLEAPLATRAALASDPVPVPPTPTAPPAPSTAPVPIPKERDEAPPAARRFSAGDASYVEPGDPCATLADVADVEASYDPAAPRRAAEELARRRYPSGLPFLQAQDDKTLGVWLRGAPPTFAGLVQRFDPLVHEGSHIWGAKRFAMATVSYSVRADLTIETKRLKNFDRSEVLTAHPDAAGDHYASTYLTGASGAQGFNTLLDEYNAYTHSLASRVCTRDLLGASHVSARDGVLAMMFFVETYLRLARERHPADYEAILKDPGHRRLILTVWDRAEHWLRKSEPFASLGVNDARYEGLAYAPERLAEIARVRDASR
jgi:hypothetical protein